MIVTWKTVKYLLIFIIILGIKKYNRKYLHTYANILLPKEYFQLAYTRKSSVSTRFIPLKNVPFTLPTNKISVSRIL